MNLKPDLDRLTADQGLTLLELLAHNLTIQVRVASSRTVPNGNSPADETRKSMYWINESLHNVVQLTRELRIGDKNWHPDDTHSWMQLWLGYAHAGEYVASAIDRSFVELSSIPP